MAAFQGFLEDVWSHGHKSIEKKIRRKTLMFRTTLTIKHCAESPQSDNKASGSRKPSFVILFPTVYNFGTIARSIGVLYFVDSFRLALGRSHHPARHASSVILSEAKDLLSLAFDGRNDEIPRFTRNDHFSEVGGMGAARHMIDPKT